MEIFQQQDWKFLDKMEEVLGGSIKDTSLSLPLSLHPKGEPYFFQPLSGRSP